MSRNLAKRQSCCTATPQSDAKRMCIKYELEISPPAKPKQEAEEKAVLVFKQFASPTFMSFDGVIVGSSVEKLLIIHNPHADPLHIQIEKFPSMNFSLSNDSFAINAGERYHLLVTWKPDKVVNCREEIVFNAKKRLKCRVILIGHAVAPPMKKKPQKRKVKAEPVFENAEVTNKENVFFLHPNSEVIDSPRRQTYSVLQSMFRYSLARPLIENPASQDNVNARRETFAKVKSPVSDCGNDSLEEVSNGDETLGKVEQNDERLTLKLEKMVELPSICNRGEATSNFNSFDSTLITKPVAESGVMGCASTLVMDTLPESNEVLDITCCPSVFPETVQKCSTAIHNWNSNLTISSAVASPVLREDNDRKFRSPPKKISYLVPKKGACKSPRHSPIKSPPTNRTKHSNKATALKKTAVKSTLKPKSNATLNASSTKKSVQRSFNAGSSFLGSNKLLTAVPKKLNLIKRSEAAAIQHPNPYAATNMYYDERWMEKQEKAFSCWLNFMLTPDDFSQSNDSIQDMAKLWVQSMKSQSVVLAPTKEQLSLKAYTAIRKMNSLRSAACKLLQSKEVVSVIQKIEAEVEQGRFLIRNDRAVHADIGIRKDILGLIMNYNPLWLRLGLETIYGEIINIDQRCLNIGLSRFVIQRFLINPNIAARYGHPVLSNVFRPGYEVELKKFILKKFLVLVFFLDVAKKARLVDHDPCLFRKCSEYKESRDFLLVFSREYLSGEGDITKHLKYLGYVVSHKQTPLMEFDFAVSNIAADLRCGIRLARILELIFKDCSITETLRLPAQSRLQKIHNNNVVIKFFKEAGHDIEGNVSSNDLVNGHRERTLSFLWQIIFKTQIGKLINPAILKSELECLGRCLHLRAEATTLNCAKVPSHPEGFDMNYVENHLYKNSESIQMLLQWCQCVCGHYGVQVQNFTSSFSDGRALCFLVHHYLPKVLPFSLIQHKTSAVYFEELRCDDESSGAANNNYVDTNSEKMKMFLKNERSNIKLAFDKFQEIGGIPITCSPQDISNTIPDEKVIITVVSHLHHRLMSLSREMRAARTIQFYWHKRQLRKHQKQLEIEAKACIKIQLWWKKIFQQRVEAKRCKASIIIQSWWRKHQCMRQLAVLKREKHLKFFSANAIVIQAAIRGYQCRKRLQKYQAAAVVLQSSIRSWQARAHYLKLKRTTLLLQQRYRANKLMRTENKHYLHLRYCVIKLQASLRGFLVRKQCTEKNSSAIIIQKYVRGFLAQKQYRKVRRSAMIIQKHMLGFVTRKQYTKTKQSARIIQTNVRGFLAQKRYLKMRRSAVIIQKYIRRFLAQKQYANTKSSVIIIQKHVRGFLAKQQFTKKRRSAVMIQKHIRGILVHKQYLKQRRAAVIIQKHVQGFLAWQQYTKMRRSAVVIQKHVRGFVTWKRYTTIKQSTVIIQKRVRGFLAWKQYTKMKSSAVIIQKYVRGFLSWQQYTKMKNSAVVIQKRVRGFLAQRQYMRMRGSAVIIQKHVRGFLAQRQYATLKSSAVIIQKYARGFLAQKQYRKMRGSAVIIQKHVRGFLAQRQYMKMRGSAVIIQKHVRGFLVQKQFAKKKRLAVIIQKHVRSFLAKKRYASIRNSIVTIQKHLRGFLTKRQYTKMRKAAVVIQKQVRGFLVQKLYMKKKKIGSDHPKSYTKFLGTETIQEVEKISRDHSEKRTGFLGTETVHKDEKLCGDHSKTCSGFLGMETIPKDARISSDHSKTCTGFLGAETALKEEKIGSGHSKACTGFLG